jgi:phosphate transport system ATP-binding protein
MMMLEEVSVAPEALKPQETELQLDRVGAYYGSTLAVADVSLDIAPKSITALIGPSGCGKSTLLRSINRLHETTPGARVTGHIRLGVDDLYAPGTDPVEVRSRIGMVFQRANPFPTLSIRDNVLAGVRLRGGRLGRSEADALVENTLLDVGLWEEVKDRLSKSGASLSGGQQQRLCIARAVAVQPEVILMDEPCSALDPASTATIENLMLALKTQYTVVIVTHNMAQAVRVSDVTAFISTTGPGEPGRLIEADLTPRLFSDPLMEATRDYIQGKVG